MNTESIKSIKDFKTLAHFLAEELSWPIDPDNVDVDSLTFEYQPEEIGLSTDFAAKVQTIKQIRPLDANQPWSIFWIDFENKKLPITVLRRILNVFVTKKRGNTKNIATKEMEDIMFVSGHGENKNRAITFAHFKRLDDVETIREFYWDGHETKFDHIASYLEKLEWPSNTTDIDGWRKKWKAAFTGSTREAITTSDQLARAMANIAKNIRDRVLEVLEVEHSHGPVHKLYDTFRTGLVHDMTEKGFADMYAQTITYGLFSARTMDTDGHFELHEVIDLIPTTNPFLKNLFKECLSTGDKNHKIDLDELGVGRLVDLFDNLNRSDGTDAMQRILAEFGRQTFSGQEDPVIHFYEGFLKEYDSLQRVEKGVYYTPDPVVKFIVRSVNEQLKSEFGLEYGLADTTTWTEMVASGRAEYPVDPNTGKVNKDWIEKIKGRAFVQILDPATGTGTFLKHVIEVILEEIKLKFKKEQIKGTWEEYWNDYVSRNLLPRLYGYELMMASYTVAHMKLGMFLKSTGYKFDKDKRLNIYLTNSLDSYNANNSTSLFFSSIGAESEGANEVKKNRFFSVIIGNPPYANFSSNLSQDQRSVVNNYRYFNGVKIKERNQLQFERNIQDDYVKFIAIAEKNILSNGVGIISLITNATMLVSQSLRGMRQHLMKTFNQIYELNLHGGTNEIGSDLILDENVFDIVQSVCIHFYLKNNNDNLGFVRIDDIYGPRKHKYDILLNSSIGNRNWVEVNPDRINCAFTRSDNNIGNESMPLTMCFKQFGAGIKTNQDEIAIGFTHTELSEKLINSNLVNSVVDLSKFIKPIYYRPFDNRYIYYNKNIVKSMSFKTMNNMLIGENIGLIASSSWTSSDRFSVGSTDKIIEMKTGTHDRGTTLFPLYLYFNTNGIITKESNFSAEFINNWHKVTSQKIRIDQNNENSIGFSDVYFWIFGLFNSPQYRQKYKNTIALNFPIVLFPKNNQEFKIISEFGKNLHRIQNHLNEQIITTSFPKHGNNEVTNSFSAKSKSFILLDNNIGIGRVYINKEQYFENVPEVAWSFYLGGYQPAQKWLKDRKGRVLTADDINHYQKIIVALTETHRIMNEIDKIDFMEDQHKARIVKLYPESPDIGTLAAEDNNHI